MRGESRPGRGRNQECLASPARERGSVVPAADAESDACAGRLSVVELTRVVVGWRLSAVARRAFVAVLLAACLGSSADAAETSGLRPGDRIGSMRLARGTASTADLKLFDICDPIVVGSVRQTRRCGRVPRVKRLFVGYGSFDPPGKIDRLWTHTSWSSWIDGRRIELSAFGSSDRILAAFPPAGGKDVTLREWRVMLVGATPGRHTLRYRSTGPDGKGDVTWRFTVASG